MLAVETTCRAQSALYALRCTISKFTEEKDDAQNAKIFLKNGENPT